MGTGVDSGLKAGFLRDLVVRLQLDARMNSFVVFCLTRTSSIINWK